MKSLTDLLSEIKARYEAVTPEPDLQYLYERVIGLNDTEEDNEDAANDRLIEFITNARTDMPRLIAALEKVIEQRDYFCSKLMNHELQMDKITKHIPQGFNDELQAILAGEKK